MTIEKNTKVNELTEDEKAQLKLWASATPAQRLAWLEEMQQIAYKAGALGSVQEADWPVTFEQVEDAQLRDMLKATPAQRLAMAEELMNFVRMAHKAKRVEE